MENEYELMYDLHTHTTYSHGKGSVEDNVRAAMNKGLGYIAISDHGPGHIFYGINRLTFSIFRVKNHEKYHNVMNSKTYSSAYLR